MSEPKPHLGFDGPLPELDLDEPEESGTSRAVSGAIAKAPSVQPPAPDAPPPLVAIEVDYDHQPAADATPRGHLPKPEARPKLPKPGGAKKGPATPVDGHAVGPVPVGPGAPTTAARPASPRTAGPAVADPSLPAGRPSAASLPGGMVLEAVDPAPGAAGRDPSTPDEAEEAHATAAFGTPPRSALECAVYVVRVFLRQRALRSELVELRKAASDATRAVDRRLVRFGHDAATLAQTQPALAGLAQQVKQLEAGVAVSDNGHHLAREAARGELEQALLTLARRALADTTLSGPELTRVRDEVAGLERLAASRARTVRIHELALRAYDEDAYHRGRFVLLVAGVLAFLLFISPAIKNYLFPPPVDTLPHDDVGLRP